MVSLIVDLCPSPLMGLTTLLVPYVWKMYGQQISCMDYHVAMRIMLAAWRGGFLRATSCVLYVTKPSSIRMSQSQVMSSGDGR
jgi:hypothetical protein